MQNKRLKNILAAGALTGLILATFIAFAWRDAGRADAATTAGNQATVTTVTATSDAQGANTLQAENEQLRSALETMQAREQQYQAQLEAANQTILQLQNTVNNAPSPRLNDDDRGEHEEHEYGEYEND